MMIMAIDLYEDEAPANLSHFTVFALNKLRQFVDSRKELTAQSYRFFVEHAYNQFFQHEAFHQSARARTKVKECGSGDFHVSTKLDGYIWIAGTEKIAHIPEKEMENVDMEDHNDDDADEELEFLPRLQVLSGHRKRKVEALKRERNHNNSKKKLLHLKFKLNQKMTRYQMQILEEILKTDMDYF